MPLSLNVNLNSFPASLANRGLLSPALSFDNSTFAVERESSPGVSSDIFAMDGNLRFDSLLGSALLSSLTILGIVVATTTYVRLFLHVSSHGG